MNNSDHLRLEKLSTYLQMGSMDGEAIVLTPKDEELLDRYNYCHEQLYKCSNDREVIRRLTSKYGYHRSLAYKDLDMTKKLFGSMLRLNKDFERMRAADDQRKVMAKCLEKGKFSEYNKGMSNLIKILQLDIDDRNNPDPSTFILPSEIILGDFEELLEVKVPKDFHERLKKYTKTKSDQFGIEDVEFEDLP